MQLKSIVWQSTLVAVALLILPCVSSSADDLSPAESSLTAGGTGERVDAGDPSSPLAQNDVDEESDDAVNEDLAEESDNTLSDVADENDNEAATDMNDDVGEVADAAASAGDAAGPDSG